MFMSTDFRLSGKELWMLLYIRDLNLTPLDEVHFLKVCNRICKPPRAHSLPRRGRAFRGLSGALPPSWVYGEPIFLKRKRQPILWGSNNNDDNKMERLSAQQETTIHSRSFDVCCEEGIPQVVNDSLLKYVISLECSLECSRLTLLFRSCL